MATIATLIPRVRQKIDERVFSTVGTAASSSSTITVTDGTDWDEGAVGEFQDNGEQFLVQSIAANVLTAKRGWNGTTAAAHSSIEVWRDPKFTYVNVEDAIEIAVKRLWPYAWKAVNDTVTPAPTTTVWYGINSLALGLIQAVQEYGANGEKLGFFGEPRQSSKRIQFEKNLNQTFVTDGTGVRFPDGFFSTTNNVLIKYAAAITGSTSDINDDGELPVADAVILGALAELLPNEEVDRVSHGEDVEQGRSIRPGARLQTGGYYEQRFRAALRELLIKHRETIPIMPMKRVRGY